MGRTSGQSSRRASYFAAESRAPEGADVKKLDVSAHFLITIGHGSGPETELVVATNREDGSPVDLAFPKNPNDGPVEVFISLSTTWGAFLTIALTVVAVAKQRPGFCGLRVTGPADLPPLENLGISVLGVIVDTGKERGQALACCCKPARVEPPWADAMRSK